MRFPQHCPRQSCNVRRDAIQKDLKIVRRVHGIKRTVPSLVTSSPQATDRQTERHSIIKELPNAKDTRVFSSDSCLILFFSTSHSPVFLSFISWGAFHWISNSSLSLHHIGVKGTGAYVRMTLKFQLLFSFCLFLTPLRRCVWIAACGTLLRFVAFRVPCTSALLCIPAQPSPALLMLHWERWIIRVWPRKISFMRRHAFFDLRVHVRERGAQHSWTDAYVFIMFFCYYFPHHFTKFLLKTMTQRHFVIITLSTLIKGIVQPNMDICLFSSLYVVPNPYDVKSNLLH